MSCYCATTPPRPAPSSDGLGLLPAIPIGVWLAGALGLTAGAAGVVAKQRAEETIFPLQLNLPAPPSSPAAPITVQQLTQSGAWTPAEMIERTNQDFRTWQAGFRSGTLAVAPNLNNNRAAGPGADRGTAWLVAAGLGLVALVLITRR
jgi:hypothetical protein